MSSEPVTAYLGLGSNMGKRQGNLDMALEMLAHRLSVERVSSIYDTEPIDNTEQPRFLNMVLQVKTRLAPTELATLAQGIELKLGRTPHTHNTPRPIDIDILFYGNQVIKTTKLIIPHPRLTERAFALIPLAEIAPTLVHPVNGKSIRKLLQEITETQGVLKWEDKD